MIICDEIAEYELVEVDESAAIAHAVVVAQLKADMKDATGREGVGVLGDDACKTLCG